MYILAVLALLSGCRSVQYVPVETVRTERDSVNIRDSVAIRNEVNYKDSTIIKDSTVIVQDEAGNVLKEKYYRTEKSYTSLQKKYDELISAYAALLSEKKDTVEVPVPVEKPLSKWQQFKLDVGGYALCVGVVLVLVVVGYLVYKLKKH